MFRLTAQDRAILKDRQPGTIRTASATRATHLQARLNAAGHFVVTRWIGDSNVQEISLPSLPTSEAAAAFHKVFCDACWQIPKYLEAERAECDVWVVYFEVAGCLGGWKVESREFDTCEEAQEFIDNATGAPANGWIKREERTAE